MAEFAKGLLSKKRSGFKDTKAEWRHLDDVFVAEAVQPGTSYDWDYLKKQVDFFENELRFEELQQVLCELLTENTHRYTSYNVFC